MIIIVHKSRKKLKFNNLRQAKKCSALPSKVLLDDADYYTDEKGNKKERWELNQETGIAIYLSTNKVFICRNKPARRKDA